MDCFWGVDCFWGAWITTLVGCRSCYKQHTTTKGGCGAILKEASQKKKEEEEVNDKREKEKNNNKDIVAVVTPPKETGKINTTKEKNMQPSVPIVSIAPSATPSIIDSNDKIAKESNDKGSKDTLKNSDTEASPFVNQNKDEEFVIKTVSTTGTNSTIPPRPIIDIGHFNAHNKSSDDQLLELILSGHKNGSITPESALKLIGAIKNK